ncbi:hypothetical protein [Amycolatopsis magusensis]|uniref:LPXTG-motif cell wall anchor domain-containing protein n=1 Tax=Amycolatopsis magusensis TaxID=882444 RepID=A0ABS4PJJ5_9PSEU|nr:hypothetical protein [Amycolatopsis magusensis]MBP2179597.1 hypothetical protein [Amycolatopsis magusensis]
MSIRRIAFTGVLAGAMALLPFTAFAEETTPSEAPVTTSPAPPSEPAEEPPVTEQPGDNLATKFWLTSKTARPGDLVTAKGRCVTPHRFNLIEPEGFTQVADKSVQRDGGTDVHVTLKVGANTKPGDYRVTLLCDYKEPSAVVKVVSAEKAAVVKDVPAKQVTKVPAGAPETGSGPAGDDPASVAWLIAGLTGAGALTAGGVVLARRRTSGAR